MKTQSFFYRIETRVEFTKEEVDILTKCSAAHYDHKCQAAHQVGGVIYNMDTEVKWASEEGKNPSMQLTWQQVDLLAKITEMLSQSWQPYYQEAKKLHYFFAKTLNEMRERFEKANT